MKRSYDHYRERDGFYKKKKKKKTKTKTEELSVKDKKRKEKKKEKTDTKRVSLSENWQLVIKPPDQKRSRDALSAGMNSESVLLHLAQDRGGFMGVVADVTG